MRVLLPTFPFLWSLKTDPFFPFLPSKQQLPHTSVFLFLPMSSNNTFITCLVNLAELRLKMMETVASSFVEYRAIVFGGYIRDLLIRQHFTSIFKSKGLPMDNFWDSSFDPKTAKRLLVPTDIDIALYSSQNISLLLDSLEKKGISVSSETKIPGGYLREQPAKHFVIKVRLSNDLLLTGHEISCSLDITVLEGRIEPPFNNTDMMCNLFIMDRHGIRLSNNTNTPIDKMSPVEKKGEELRILNNMFKFKTQKVDICEDQDDLRSPEAVKRRQRRVERIVKMQKRGWKFTNIKDVEVMKKEKKEEEIKCITCLENLNEEEQIVRLNCCKEAMCIECVEKHCKKELGVRTKVRCPNTCSKRREGWDIV